MKNKFSDLKFIKSPTSVLGASILLIEFILKRILDTKQLTEQQQSAIIYGMIISLILTIIAAVIIEYIKNNSGSKSLIGENNEYIQKLFTEEIAKYNGFWVETFDRTINNKNVEFHSLFKLEIDSGKDTIQISGKCYAKGENDGWIDHAKWSAQHFNILNKLNKSPEDSIYYAFRSNILEQKVTNELTLSEDVGCGYMYFHNIESGTGWFISKHDSRFGDTTKFKLTNVGIKFRRINWEEMTNPDSLEYLSVIEEIHKEIL